MAKKVYNSPEQGETAKTRAVNYLRNVIGDDERADEIEAMSLDEWLEETGRSIRNPERESSIRAAIKARRSTLDAQIRLRTHQGNYNAVLDLIRGGERGIDLAKSAVHHGRKLGKGDEAVVKELIKAGLPRGLAIAARDAYAMAKKQASHLKQVEEKLNHLLTHHLA